MKSIVIPVDFSETSAVATQFGAYLAVLMNCDLRIVHVSDIVLSGEHSLTTPEQKRDEEKLEEELSVFARDHTYPAFTANPGRTSFVPKVSHSILSGMAAHHILSLSNESTTLLIVMGSVGAGAGIHPPGLYGSVATPVALRGKCPVILIPKGYGPVAVEKLAIAFDDADEIIRIGKSSKAIIDALHPEVRYVHVSKASWQQELENEDNFTALTWRKDVPFYTYEPDLLPEGNVAEQLSKYVDDRQIDLLILGGKRKGFWRQLFDKKHLKPIIMTGKVPMMVVPFSTDDD